MPSLFDSPLKPMVDLVPDLKIRSTETQGENVLTPTHMVNGFISKSFQPDVFFNTSVMKNFIKFTVKDLR